MENLLNKVVFIIFMMQVLIRGEGNIKSKMYWQIV